MTKMYLCFDFGIPTAIHDEENKKRGNVGTRPYLGEFGMRNSLDLNDFWYKILIAIRLRICDYDLESNWAVISTFVVGPSTTEVSRLSLPLCLGESHEIVDKHSKHSKRKSKHSRINIHSRETVGIIVNYFARKLSSWACFRQSQIDY